MGKGVQGASIEDDRLTCSQGLHSALAVLDQGQFLLWCHGIGPGNQSKLIPEDPKRLRFHAGIGKRLGQIAGQSGLSS